MKSQGQRFTDLICHVALIVLCLGSLPASGQTPMPANAPIASKVLLSVVDMESDTRQGGRAGCDGETIGPEPSASHIETAERNPPEKGNTAFGPGILAPVYFDPQRPEGALQWGKLAQAAGKIEKRLIVIGNISNGPGREGIKGYEEAFRSVVSQGGRVIGYVYTCWGNGLDSGTEKRHCPRPHADILRDVDLWYANYPMIDGIFFDEVSTDPYKIPYYRMLYDYTQRKQPGSTVAFNCGTEPHQDYFSIGSSILCAFEGPFSSFSNWFPQHWTRQARTCALVFDTSKGDLQEAFDHLLKLNIGWFYFTSDTMADRNPWDSLPPYFPGLVNGASKE